MPEIIINEILNTKSGEKKNGELYVMKTFNAVVKDDKGTRTQKLVGFDNFVSSWVFETGKRFEGYIPPLKSGYNIPTFVITSEIFDQDGDVIPPKPEPPNKEYVPSDTAEPGEIKTSPPSSTTSTDKDVEPTYAHTKDVKLRMWGIEQANMFLSKRNESQSASYKDLTDIAKKVIEYVQKGE